MSKPEIQGIYEVCIGVYDPLPMLQYWEQFGYRIGEIGELSLSNAETLYGTSSNLRSIRLYHQNADCGLIRLMVWETPQNEGLQMTSMKVLGNRWTTTLTADVLTLLNHTEEAAAAGFPVKYTDPSWEVIYKVPKARPFLHPPIGVREMMLLQPLTRQVFFERFNYTVENYGKINPHCAFKTSEVTHAGIIVQDDSQESLRFYDEVLGLLRSRDDAITTYESSQAAREIFDLEPNESFTVTTFDDPRSSTDWKLARSGRLYIIRFPESIALTNCYHQSKPGCLGVSLYTYSVNNLEDYYSRLQASSASNMSQIISNEFGEASFSFTCPNGYSWTLIKQNSF